MKRRNSIQRGMFLAIAIVSAAGCVSRSLVEDSSAPFGKDTCLESPLVGSWKADIPEGETITFKQDCTAVSVRCQMRFQFPPNAASAGLANIKVLESDGPKGCLGTGTYRCSFNLMMNSGTMICDGKKIQLNRL